MAFKKIGENLSFSAEQNILTAKEALADDNITVQFIKMAKQLKKIAPKAEDFLYGHAIMMHAAEACLIDQETGKPKLNAKGEPIKGAFESVKIKGKDSVKWSSPDNIKPYKNANGDIFPEAELLKAYKKWVGKPLCKDHKSDSVDGIRGIIIDTYYDPNFKRVHALFALDKKNYADLARKVETGYANCVSMGTAVGRSVCTECSHVAQTEKEYCEHIRARSNYGEINLDLNPIELSLVVNGADGLAKIRNIIASMNNYVQQKQDRITELKSAQCVNPSELHALADAVNEIQSKLHNLLNIEKTASTSDLGEDTAASKEWRELKSLLEKTTDPTERAKIEKMISELEANLGLKVDTPESPSSQVGDGEGFTNTQEAVGESGKMGWPPFDPSKKMAKNEGDNQGAISSEIRLLRSKVNSMISEFNSLKQLISMEENRMNSARLRARAKARRAYWLGGGDVNEPTPGKPKYEKEDAESIRNKEDKQMVGEPLETGSEGLHPGDMEVKTKLLRAEENKGRQLTAEELKERSLRRKAYWLGGGGINEPTPGKPKYEKEDADSIRNKEDKQMSSDQMDAGTDGAFPGDMELKKKLLRAKLRAKFTKVADSKGSVVKEASRWDLFAGDTLLVSATAKEIFEDDLLKPCVHEDGSKNTKFATNWDFLASQEYGQAIIKAAREEGVERVRYLLKGAQEPAPAAEMAPPPAEMAAPAPEAAAPVDVAGKGGDVSVKQEKSETQTKVNAALASMEEKIAEIRDLVSGMDSEELVDIDVNVDSKDKGAAPEAAAPAPMEGVLAKFRNDALQVEALLNDSADELALISEALEQNSDSKLLKAAAQALADGNTVLAEAGKVIQAAKKKDKKEDKKDDEEKSEKKKDKKEDKKDDEEMDDKKKEAQLLLEKALKVRAKNRADLLAVAMGDQEPTMEEMMAMYALTPEEESKVKKLLPQEEAEGHQLAKDKDVEEDEEVEEDEKDEDDKDSKKEDKKDKEDDSMDMGQCAEDCMAHDHGMTVTEAPAMALAARKKERDALIARAGDILGKYELDLGTAENVTEPTYFEAHPGGKGTVTQLDVKTPEAKVETISEVHDVMRDVAESGPRNVREAAALLQEALVKGAFKVEDIDRLVAEGKVDGAAASYWKKYFAQAPNAGSFGADLSKEFAGKKKEASDTQLQAKFRRAYGVALDAQEKGLVGNTRQALEQYVDDIMKLSDEAFESMKRILSNTKTTKKATSGSIPRVGVDDAAQQSMTSIASVESVGPSLTDQLSKLGWK